MRSRHFGSEAIVRHAAALTLIGRILLVQRTRCAPAQRPDLNRAAKVIE
jgi:hypothetical protein